MSGSSMTITLHGRGKAMAGTTGTPGSSTAVRVQALTASATAWASYEGLVRHGIQPLRDRVSYSQPRPRTR